MSDERAERLLRRWQDPVAFAVDTIQVPDPRGGLSSFRPWPRQAEMMRACATAKRSSTRSGHKTGKTTSAAALALWFWATKPDARVVLTAPTYRQINEVLWRQIRIFHRTARLPFGGVLNESPTAGLVDGANQIIGIATNEPEKFSGISGANVLYLVDEASGVDEAIFEAIEGNRAGGAWVALFSNPTQLAGTFYESHTTAEGWLRLHVTSEEAAAYQQQTGQRIPGLATPEWVEEMRMQWGVDDPRYHVRVLGNFPETGARSVVGLALVRQSQERWSPSSALVDFPAGKHRLRVGVDVARFGDDETACIGVRGHHVYEPETFSGLDVVQVAQRAVEYAKRCAIAYEGDIAGTKKPLLLVDEIGIGAGVVDVLKRQFRRHVDVAGVNAAAAPNDRASYPKLRDEMWFGLTEFLKEGGRLPPSQKLLADLVAVEYDYDAQNRRKVVAKDVTREKLGRSPDCGDALCLAVRQVEVYRPKSFRLKGL